jgi:predicted Zn-dependent protease
MRFLILGLALTVVSCATNPATGKREISFMSEAQEIQMGRDLDAQVRQEMGLYRDDELQRYVEQVGMRLAKQSERPNLPWSFVVLDSPAVNAFALPGGFIYITRGILPYLDNEAQLAGVIGHEIGHVAARHSAQQYTRSMGTSLGLLVGSIFVPEIAPFSNVAEGGLSMMFLKFSRDAELQADGLGAGYVAASGWDPEQVPEVLKTLARISELSDRNGTPNWLSTHPEPENRFQRVGALLQKVRVASAAPLTVDRDGYLNRIDGIVFGENPEDGIVRGSLFLHPDMRLAVEFPDGWDIANTDTEVVAQEPGNKVFMVLKTVRGPSTSRSLEQAGLAHMKGAGYKPVDGALTTINGLEAYVATYQGNASGLGKAMSRAAHIAHGRSTYFLGGIASPEIFPKVLNEFNKAIASFRGLDRDEADNIRPNVVDLYIARDGDTWQSIAQRAGRGLVKASTLAIMNDHAVDDQPKLGERLKIVVAGS